MLLKEGIQKPSTIDQQEMQLFLNKRSFWKNVLERLIDIVIFLYKRNLTFRGLNKVLGSQQNGNFLGLFELLSKRDFVLSELKNRVIRHTIKQHYLSNTIQNELIYVVAEEVEKNLPKELKKGKYYSIILDCTPDISLKEQCLCFLLSCVLLNVTKIRELL